MSFFDSAFFDPAFFDTGVSISSLTTTEITQAGARHSITLSNAAAGNLYLAIYPAAAPVPTWDRVAGWSGSPVYTDADTSPETSGAYTFVPDSSGLTAGTPYVWYAVWDDGTDTVGPVASPGFTTASATADLIVSSATHTHTADTLTLSAGSTLVIQSASHPHSVDTLALAAGLSLDLHDSSHAHGADTATLSAALTLSVAEALHAHGADNIDLLTASTPAGDPYWEDVVSLMHFDGPDKSTTFTDETGRTWSAFGSVEIDTEFSVFGGASYTPAPSGGIQTQFVDAIGTEEDFTFEFWARPRQVATGRTLLDLRKSSSLGVVITQPGANPFSFRAYAMGSTGGDNVTLSSGAISENTWYHLAFTRQGDTFRFFVNGALAAVTVSGVVVDFADTMSFGNNIGLSSSVWFNGNLDELRVTKGVARYTAPFYPASEAFPGAPASESVTLSTAASSHTHVADNVPLLSGGATLDVAQGQHAHAADHIELSAAVALVAHDAIHAHSADTASFTGAADLAVQGASHAHAAETPSLILGLALTIAHAFHEHVSSDIDLSAALGLSIESALHTHGADEAVLTAALQLVLDDTFHEHMAQHLMFVVPVPLVDLLRRSVFLRAARQRAVVRTQDQRIFGRVE
jgi:hypothetical protein